jgi:hypothetical protein
MLALYPFGGYTSPDLNSPNSSGKLCACVCVCVGEREGCISYSEYIMAASIFHCLLEVRPLFLLFTEIFLVFCSVCVSS